jgi:hypothetical protein
LRSCEFRVDGSISKDNVYDLNINGDNADLSRVKRILPGSMAGALTAYNPSGTMSLGCSIKGPLTKTLSPHVEIELQRWKWKNYIQESTEGDRRHHLQGKADQRSGKRAAYPAPWF